MNKRKNEDERRAQRVKERKPRKTDGVEGVGGGYAERESEREGERERERKEMEGKSLPSSGATRRD